MEEDIKLVENLIEEYKIFGDLDGIQDLKPYMGAIEHLIKGYKELEERLKIKRNTPEWEYQYWEARKEVDNEWKSKIKEKIEEINREIKHEDNEKVIIWLHKQRKILQELLEKRK